MAKITLERVLREDDDASGQSIRSWHIERDGNFIWLRSSADSDESALLILLDDIWQLFDDVNTVASIGTHNGASAPSDPDPEMTVEEAALHTIGRALALKSKYTGRGTVEFAEDEFRKMEQAYNTLARAHGEAMARTLIELAAIAKAEGREDS